MGHRSDPLGPLPDVDDRVAFEQYVAATEKWRYFAINDQTLPKTEGGTVPFTIEKGKTYFGEDDEDSIFNGPATPAEVIVFALAQTVRTNPDIRKQLPDVSFFPFRKEHFFLGIPSLERPPPSGDDPIGDAGMGRGLLFLKWALEGAFLPPVGPFPQSLVANDPGNAEPPPPLDDLETRSQIFERIMEREEELVVEGYEWGAYQEFALLRESAHLRMERIHKDQEGNEIDRPRIFDDLAVAYENKIMKKVGKAVVRGMLAKMISDSTMRTAFLETDPKKFDETAALKSFEHLIAKTAKDNNFSGLTKDQIDDFLQAKLGDEKVFNKIRMDEDGVDEFIKKGFRFLREEVQEPLEDDFSDELDILEFHGRFYERGLRLNNSVAVDYGALLAASSSGRAQMHGVEGDYEAPFSFIVALHKRRNKEEATGLSIKLESDGNPMSLTCDNLKLDADRNVLVVNKKNDKKQPFFTVGLKAADGTEIKNHTLTLDGATADNDTDDSNNKLEFKSRFLEIGNFFSEDIETEHEKPTRILFRGLLLDDAAVADVRAQLVQGNLPSNARRNIKGTTEEQIDAQARVLMLQGGTYEGIGGTTFTVPVADSLQGELDKLNAAIPKFQSFSQEDFDKMSPEQKVGVYHLSSFFDWTPIISLSQNRTISEDNFASQNHELDPDPNARSILLAFELPVGDGIDVDSGLEYVPTALNAGPGGTVYRRLGSRDTAEVMFFDKVEFIRCWMFDITYSQPPGQGYGLGGTLIEVFESNP